MYSNFVNLMLIEVGIEASGGAQKKALRKNIKKKKFVLRFQLSGVILVSDRLLSLKEVQIDGTT